MFVLLLASEGKLVCLKEIGKLTRVNYQKPKLKFESILKNHCLMDLYADWEEFQGSEW